MATPISTPSLSSRSLSNPPTPSRILQGLSMTGEMRQNSIDSNTPWIVQKFGGTTVGKFAVKIAEDALAGYLRTHRIAIVCSARSGSTKALGTTNLLLKAASEALSGRKPSSTTPMQETNTPWSNAWAPTPPIQSPQSFSPPHTPRSTSSHGHSTLAMSAMTNGLSALLPVNSFDGTVDLIKSEHLCAARSLIRDPDLLKQLEDEITRDAEWLRSFLSAASVIEEISPRSKDSIVGVGERLGCKLVAGVLKDRGFDSEFVSLESIVPKWDDIDVQSDRTLSQDFYDRLPQVLAARLAQCGPRIPIITGFFGPVPGSLLHQIGRGYTDLLSALVAVGLKAEELQIWKEVDGIFTADPRKVPTARLLKEISPEEAAELTYYGSEVIHPFTMEQVISKGISIRIKNIMNASGPGTIIRPQSPSSTPSSLSNSQELPSIPPVTSLSNLALTSANTISKGRLPTAVTFKENIVVINITSNKKNVSHGFLMRIFQILDRHGLIVDLISTSEVHVSMAAENKRGARALDRLIAEFEKLGTVTIVRDMVILSLVGRHMRNMVGIAGRMFSTLAEGKVNIEMISQGASEINISCVIDGKDALKALNLIHQSCLERTGGGLIGGVDERVFGEKNGGLGAWLF